MDQSVADRTLLDFKPLAPRITDEQWLVMVDLEGIAPSMARCFWHWLRIEQAHGRKPKAIRPDMHEYLRLLFGQVGYTASVLAGHDREAFISELFAQEWRADELGALGEWAAAAGMAPHATQLLKIILNDWVREATES
jgi:hypothetical protein